MAGLTPDPYFGTAARMPGLRPRCEAYEKDGEGAVVMTNAQGGGRMAEEVMRSIATVYHWPDFQAKVRTAVKVDEKILRNVCGDV